MTTSSTNRGLVDLNKLSPTALKAAITGGTDGWGHGGSIHNVRYAEPVAAKSRRRCGCGCKRRASHRGMANGVSLITGCELRVARWIKEPLWRPRPLPSVPEGMK